MLSPLFFNLCFVFFQVPTAFPVEPQFTFSNQTQGEPFPLENRSSMGEVQVKTLWAVFILQKYSTCGWSYKNPKNMVWHFSCLVLIGDEIRRGVHQSRSPVVYRYISDIFRLFSLSMSFVLSLFSGYSRLLHHRQPHLETWWEYSTLTVYITKYPTIAIHRCYLIDTVMEGVHSKIAVKMDKNSSQRAISELLGGIVIKCGPICSNYILAEVFSFIIKGIFQPLFAMWGKNCTYLCTSVQFV